MKNPFRGGLTTTEIAELVSLPPEEFEALVEAEFGHIEPSEPHPGDIEPTTGEAFCFCEEFTGHPDPSEDRVHIASEHEVLRKTRLLDAWIDGRIEAKDKETSRLLTQVIRDSDDHDQRWELHWKLRKARIQQTIEFDEDRLKAVVRETVQNSGAKRIDWRHV